MVGSGKDGMGSLTGQDGRQDGREVSKFRHISRHYKWSVVQYCSDYYYLGRCARVVLWTYILNLGVTGADGYEVGTPDLRHGELGAGR